MSHGIDACKDEFSSTKFSSEQFLNVCCLVTYMIEAADTILGFEVNGSSQGILGTLAEMLTIRQRWRSNLSIKTLGIVAKLAGLSSMCMGVHRRDRSTRFVPQN